MKFQEYKGLIEIKKICVLMMMLCLFMTGFVSVKAAAGDIFTREETKMSYPATRTIAVKTPMLEEHIQYYTSDREVAMVSKTGEIMAVGVGVCEIYAVAPDGTMDICTVTVEEPETKHKQIALTFDDGPGGYGQELLDYLEEKGIYVTFFYIGEQVSRYAANVYRAYNYGHEIGNHSFTHPVMSKLSLERIESELSKTNETIREACGAYPTVFRPPYGASNDLVRQNCNFPVILWSVDTLDWEYKDTQRVADQIYSGAVDGAIILVHEVYRTTIDGVKIAVDKLLEEGWEFVTVTELWERNGYKLKNGAVYGRKKS